MNQLILALDKNLPQDITLVGLVGVAGAGKDTVADMMKQLFGFKQFALAAAVKDVVTAAFGVPDTVQNHPIMKNHVIPELGVSPRVLAQFIGTELFREHFGEDIWIQILADRIRSNVGTKYIVVSDVRFQNEVNWIRDNAGWLLKISRPNTVAVGVAGHASEQIESLELSGRCLQIANSGTIAELRESVRHAVNSYILPVVS